MKKIKIKIEVVMPEEVNKIITRDALNSYPDECCGFLFGEDREERWITHALPVSNSKEGDKKRRFEISATDYRKAELWAVERGLTLAGVYHSHPEHPAIPSESDRSQALCFFSYVIISVKKNKIMEVTSWRLNEQQQFDEEKLITVSDVVLQKAKEYYSLTQ